MSSMARTAYRMRKDWMLYLLILPAVVYFILFAYLPVVDGANISFQNYRFVGESEYIGFQNYQRVFDTAGFWRVFRNTVILGFSNVVLTAFIPMLLAMMLNEVVFSPWKRFAQTILYLPHLFSWVVVGGIWIFILSPSGGLVNAIGAAFGADPVYFLVKEHLARPLYIGINLWKQAGYVCILFLAAIAGINPELYEAAMIDGAGGFKRALYITVPELARTLKVVLLLNVMGALRIFDQIYVMRNEVVAPKVDVLMYYIYIRGLEQFDLGYAAAISVFIFLITLVITLISRRLMKYNV
ncbi:MAG: ABC transporter permease subunit [Spirochaetia bacterium]